MNVHLKQVSEATSILTYPLASNLFHNLLCWGGRGTGC